MFGAGSASYSYEVGFFMNLDLTNSCMTASTNFNTLAGVTWSNNAFTYTTRSISTSTSTYKLSSDTRTNSNLIVPGTVTRNWCYEPPGTLNTQIVS